MTCCVAVLTKREIMCCDRLPKYSNLDIFNAKLHRISYSNFFQTIRLLITSVGSIYGEAIPIKI